MLINIKKIKIFQNIKNIFFKNLDEKIKYRLIFLLIITVFSYFFILKNVIDIAKENFNLKQIKIKKEESYSRKKSLKKKIEILKADTLNQKKSQNQKKSIYIYENSPIFKIDFEKNLKRFNLKSLESSRLEKEIISEGEKKLYEIKIYYQLIGKIENFKNLFEDSKQNSYEIQRENFIINFKGNEKEEISIKMKIKFFSYERNTEIKNNKLFFKKVDTFKLKKVELNKNYYCIFQLEESKKKIIKKEKEKNIENEEMCKSI